MDSNGPSQPKVLLVSHSFSGGAGRAAERLFQAVSTHESGSLSFLALVGERDRGKKPIVTDSLSKFKPSTFQKIAIEVPTRLARLAGGPKDSGLLSPPLVNTGLVHRINQLNPDVVNLHWLGHNTLSVKEIAEIRAPIVWTLHDEWFYRGAEHYGDDQRPFIGYLNPTSSVRAFFDLNRIIWNLKRRHWSSSMHIVCPSNWLAKNASSSVIGRDHQVHVVPNPLDTGFWKPIPALEAAKVLNLNPDTSYLLSGSLGADSDPRKGRDLVLQALQHLAQKLPPKERPEVLFFGGQARVGRIGRFQFRDLGALGDYQLRAAYSVASAMLLGSRQENLPQTATEAASCGTPVIAFNVGGLPDIVSHGKTGFLIEPFDTESMARAIETILHKPSLRPAMGQKSRKKAEQHWSEKAVSAQYREIFLEASLSKPDRVGRG